MDSYHQTGDLLADLGKEDGRHLINRLMFSHQVTALEAYLGDTLLNAVAGDAEAMQRLINDDDELAKEKFTLAEIRKEPDLVARKVREQFAGDSVPQPRQGGRSLQHRAWRPHPESDTEQGGAVHGGQAAP
jgi:hypothetical protein